MKVNFKKIFLDPISDKKIKTPSTKSIGHLMGADNYEKFKTLIKNQKKDLVKNGKKILVTGSIGLVSIGATLVQYLITRKTQADYYDEADLLINESEVVNELNNIEKENN